MLKQMMVVIITPLGHAQKYNHGVRSVFILTAINTRYNTNSRNNNNNNNNLYATHESDNDF